MLPLALLDLAIASRTVSIRHAPSRRVLRVFHRALATGVPNGQDSGHEFDVYDVHRGSGSHGISPRSGQNMLLNPVPRPRQDAHDRRLKVASPLEDLDIKLQKLEQASKGSESTSYAPTFSETDLLSFYADVMKQPIPPTPSPSSPLPQLQAPPPTTEATIQSTFGRLQTMTFDIPPPPKNDWNVHYSNSLDMRRRLLALLYRLACSVPAERVDKPATFLAAWEEGGDVESGLEIEFDEEDADTPTMALTPSFVTKAELEAVYFSLMADKDTEALEILLQLAPPLGIQFSEESKDAVLAIHADTGNTTAVESYMSKFCPEPTDTQRHLHVKAYLLSLPADTFPTPALDLVHAYEGKNAPAPMKTYTKLLSHLYALRSNSGIARAKAWDLFAHMRYVAHPDPDVVLYTTMIRACASPVAKGWRSSDPERALDLWTEMTVEKQMVPTSGSYDAIILACARSGQRVFVDHAFQLLQQMLDGHRDAYGRSAFAPTKRTWIALLEGLKRLGDLKRARWVFVEVVRRGLEAEKQLGQSEENREKGENDLDEGVMIHLFQAYASHKPNPNTPGRKKILDVPQSSTSSPSASDPSSDPSTQSAPATTTPATPPAPFASLFSGFPQSSMPTSSQEIITEVNFLFERILASRFSPTHMQSRLDKIFKHTSLTPTLLNAFLQVHYAHSPNILSIRGFFERAFTAREGVDGYLSMQPNVYSFVDALERCASQVQKHSRGMTGQEVDKMVDASAKWGEKLWEGFLALKIGELDGDSVGKLETKEARLVERAWAAYIRVLTMSGRITKALNTVKLFTSKYPPSLAEATASTALSLSPTNTTTSSLPTTPAPARPLALSSRTTLFSDNRTLINTNPQHQHTPDSYVPPILTFGDLKGLHHAIVTSTQYSEFGRRGEERRKKDVGYLTWVCHAYARGVRKRMRGVESAKVVKGSSSAEGEVELEEEAEEDEAVGEVDEGGDEGTGMLLREDGTGRRKAWEVLYREKNT